jgi:acetylglutamate kinase
MKDKLQVIKIGGNVIDDPEMLDLFIQDFAAMAGPKILIHGGGKSATQMSDQLHIPVKLVDGRRITSTANLEVVTMVYAGLISKRIVAKLSAHQCTAIGLSGADGNSMLAEKRPVTPTDFGWVGDVVDVNTAFIADLLLNDITPVFCAIGHDGHGQLLNTNADTIAAEIAIAMAHRYDTKLMYCFEKDGVLKDVNDAKSVIPHLDYAQYQTLKANHAIHDGMLPKLKNCFHALANNVGEVKVGTTAMLQQSTATCTTISL